MTTRPRNPGFPPLTALGLVVALLAGCCTARCPESIREDTLNMKAGVMGAMFLVGTRELDEPWEFKRLLEDELIALDHHLALIDAEAE